MKSHQKHYLYGSPIWPHVEQGRNNSKHLKTFSCVIEWCNHLITWGERGFESLKAEQSGISIKLNRAKEYY